MNDLSERFLAHVTSQRLFPKPGKALVAVSGGPDSLALLGLLHDARKQLGLELIVAHVDHGIQEASGQVAKGLRRQVQALGIAFELGELHLGPDTTETEAREARYAWLRETQRRVSARYLVTAHHADDQVETILLRVLRGSAPTGLAGIRAKSRGGLVRPLLPFTKAELASPTAFVDPANSDPKHLRSWVRGTLLPLIEGRLGQRVRGDLLSLGRHALRDARAWAALPELLPELDVRFAEGAFSVARLPLAGYDAPVATALLRAAARRAGIPLGPRHALRLHELAKRQSGRRVELGGGWVGEAVFDRLSVGKAAGGPRETIPMKAEGTAVFGDYRLAWRTDPAPAHLDRDGWTTWVAGMEDGLVIRAPQAGDRLAPLGGVGRREVRRLLMEARVPRAARAGYPLLAVGETIVWVPGICRGEARVPQPGTPAVRLDVTEYDQA
ncbi:MAG TPA: tRNA lysidine(34) synthetase TilS [Gemmatimonadales bacterium]|jgi:tRNA(Ile)-lysidine synthase|nr:tRNA lysidine(34) synthetase TilS [Gemmatimonadales bacterium]